jgi:hypothetical protein
MIKYKAFIFSFLVIFFACSKQKKEILNDVNQKVISDKILFNSDTLSCRIELKELKEYSIDSLFKLSDDCIIEVINHYKTNAISMNDKTDYYNLNKISNKSDGAISEYFDEVMIELFYQDLKDLSNYLYVNQSKAKLENRLIESLNLELSESDDFEKQTVEYKKLITNSNLNDAVKQYMLSIIQKLDPRMFD